MKSTAMSLPLVLTFAVTLGYAGENVVQNLGKKDYLEITDPKTKIKSIKQTGVFKKYVDDVFKVGLHFKTGSEYVLDASILLANFQSGGLLGVHGKGTHVRYKGKWKADGGGTFPRLALTTGGKMTWEPECEIDFVMHPNFFTRQLWVSGDNTGVLELAEGFISDRTKGATVPNAMGTIRLAGATLITHHSHSLPYNTRPDGRGGVYHNGHVVFEHKPGSTWIIKTNPHIYAAQIDFAAAGTIDCQAPLTHNGHRRDCLQVGNGGPFMSTGAFRTTRPNVTITKKGPAMLSLEGQQGYRPGSKLIVEEGLLRIYTDPGAGDRIHKESGVFLDLTIQEKGKLLFAAPLTRLQRLHLKKGSTCWLKKNCRLEVQELKVEEGAKFSKDGEVIEGGKAAGH